MLTAEFSENRNSQFAGYVDKTVGNVNNLWDSMFSKGGYVDKTVD